MFGKSLAIDLGTENTRIYVPGQGVVMNQSTMIAFDQDNEITAVGAKAEAMYDRQPEKIEIIRPVENGVIADFKSTRLLLEQFINQSVGRWRLRPPHGVFTVSGGATSTERRAMVELAKSAGVRDAMVIEAVVAASIGAGLDVGAAKGSMIIHFGAGTCEVAIISLSGIISSHTIRTGGATIDYQIQRYLKRHHNLHISSRRARQLKHSLGQAISSDKAGVEDVKGRDALKNLPKSLQVTGNDLVKPIEDVVEKITLAVRSVMEQASPELVSDIAEDGIMLSGGSAQLNKIDQLLRKTLNTPIITADEPELCAIKGAAEALANRDDYKQSLFNI